MALHRNKVTYSQRPNRAARAAHAKGDKQFRTYDTSAIIPRRNHVGTIVFGVVLALVAALLVFLFVTGRLGFTLPGAEKEYELAAPGTEVTFIVDEGEASSQVAQTLANVGLVRTTGEFNDAVAEAGAATQIKPGTYTIAAGTSTADILEQLLAGPSVARFTVPEGCTIGKVAEIVSEAYGGAITAEDFIDAAHDASRFAGEFPFLEGAYKNSVEGYLFPKTYDIVSGETAEGVIRRMLAQFQTEFATLDTTWAHEAGYSDYDVVKMASVIEREADDATADRVASVFYNRLAQGMRLQSDATVAYFVGRDPVPEDMDRENPYNTYRNDGIVAGPICSPGLVALQAACAPADTSYLYFYFVPNDDGGTDYYFSETFEQHRDAIEGNAQPNG